MKNLFYSIEGFKGTMWQNSVIIYEIKTNDEKALNGEYNFIETPEIIASKIKQYLIENLPKK